MSEYRNDNSFHQSKSCPFCGSKNIKIIIEKEKEDFDVTSGVLGYVCLGPIGLLCGLCSADGETEKITCICNNCGKRFIDD
ncbi:MAG: hypothetical protein HUJ77_07015 [Clostridium sp.]|mgnify:CR=1 FL=1|uniref:hypothetical protein n=1 Tax=Clostridium sp. TaxID=1506 RepID=UPI0025C04AC9|nr:hypothetical protein [Clostridium sp.]MCF0148132.1 hypothetical protein [Clostridium sp.]